ncbi:hypothetical protein Aple_072320 [Acrocarpospora pleiomorpha]|uniref:Uncharacterized protein n=1 Tax=Acrocarpospora pleiomorpha TaxID=90975 RepID=A0A5M3XY08_9ACTN|nr:hypothetical protein Aple_072320 [Acrocarpospora pleiomorpha]
MEAGKLFVLVVGIHDRLRDQLVEVSIKGSHGSTIEACPLSAQQAELLARSEQLTGKRGKRVKGRSGDSSRSRSSKSCPVVSRCVTPWW